ncbi:MAG TPA: pantoate--beta-alanine ligase [Terriglobia bacterium]|nr:pantoate--beta-alanine ligase [Terriglobia bacterium]
MRLVTSPTEMQALARNLRGEGRVVTLVPTMGALHVGHLSLMERARERGGALMVSIFVNPTQFGPHEDLERYPRNLERDLELMRPLEPDGVFTPGAGDMYPADFNTWVAPGSVATAFEGASRPGHFRGVATVVLKLLNVIGPEIAFFGQKDFQQVAVIRRMVADFDISTRIVMCPTVREPDGLAVSSRNAYLNPEERKAAPVLHRSLRRARELFHAGETRTAELLGALRTVVAEEPRMTLDYAAIAHPASMEAVDKASAGMVALVAARLGPVRLIDNLILGPAEAGDDELISIALNVSNPA